jgi:hypothetical protein
VVAPHRPRLTASPLFVTPKAQAVELKLSLLDSLRDLRQKQARDGDFSINFGFKGGELNQTTSAPQKVDYYSISEDVGKAADHVMQICQQLADHNPIETPTQYLGSKINGTLAPLNGAWKLLFTTAADATFSKNSTRGAARAQNVVDACRGSITNIIDFDTTPDGAEPLLKQLQVVIKAAAAGPKRVELVFRYAKARLTKFFFLKINWTLFIPVPPPFLVRFIVLIGRLLRNKKYKPPPKAFFDVLYLDDDLRIHKTGEENLFVQAKDNWEEARPLME